MNTLFKKLSLVFVAFLSVIHFNLALAGPKSERLELALDKVLAPSVGFDDNDQIEVVITGALPNVCYSLADYFTQVSDDGQRVEIHQYAVKQIDGICSNPSLLPEHLQIPIPFSKVILVGQLNAATYVLEAKGINGIITRDMSVVEAPVSTVDSASYAEITGLHSKDFWKQDEDVFFYLSGYTNSNCTEIDPNIQIVKQDDVLVVLPTSHVLPLSRCLPTTQPFEMRRSIGKLSPGTYLIHVRSMSGRSLNRIIVVR